VRSWSAGARAAVTTLWRVADEPARDFMAQLYFELNRGKPKAEALRLAKLRFLRSGTELRHRATVPAFISPGDGLSPIPRVLSLEHAARVVGMLLLGGGLASGLSSAMPRLAQRGRSPPGKTRVRDRPRRGPRSRTGRVARMAGAKVVYGMLSASR